MGEKELCLTDIEYRILLLLMKYPGKIFSIQNLYESVWQEPFYKASANTIMVHIRKLRSKIEEDPQNPKIIRTVWGNCESCIEKFPVVERLTEIMQGENIEIDILWRQEPKKTLVDTLDISKDKQYRTGSIKVLNEYPTYFITDEENSVQMISDDIDKIVKKMLSLDEIEKNAIIKETNIYLKKLIGQNDKQKQKLVYFAMDGCPDCQNVEKLLNDNSIASKYDMITIYTVDSKGEKECVDEGEVLKNIYDIDWYPSFLILDGDKYEFIGQESDEKLLEKLKDGIT